MSSPRRLLRWPLPLRWAVTALVVVLTVLATGGPAAAHAELIATDPAEGSVLEQAPSEVTLTFSEPVRLTSREIAVYDAGGESIESETTASGSEVTVSLPGADDLDRGTYVVGWYVVSADGHPISGSLTFSVGEASATVAQAPSAPSSPSSVAVAQGLVQALAYLGILLAIGLAVFSAHVLPRTDADKEVRGRLRLLLRVAAAVAVVTAAVQVPLAAVRAQGTGLDRLGSGLDGSLVGNETIQLALVVLGLVLVVVGVGNDVSVAPDRVTLWAGSVLVVLAPAFVGHTRAYDPQLLLVTLDALHLTAGAVWFGGLVGLVVALRPLAGREHLAAETLSRFSALAAALLLAVAGTGSVMAWRILGSWSAFVDTTYGLLLLAKIAIALVVVCVAARNRWVLLPRVRRAPVDEDRVRSAVLVTRTIAAEALLLAALLGVTGFLVNQSPRPEAASTAAERPGVQESTLGDLRVVVSMSPRRSGANTITVQLQDAEGAPADLRRPPEVEVRAAGLDLGPVALEATGASTWESETVLPKAGEWEVQVSVALSRFESRVTTLRFDVAERAPGPQ